MPLLSKMRNRSPWVLFWTLLSFVAINIALVLTIEKFAPARHHSDYLLRLRMVQNRLREKPDAPLTVAIGTSRTCMGMCAEVVSNASESTVVSIAFPGVRPPLQYLYLNRLLADNITPETVLIECMPGLFFEECPDIVDALRLKNVAELSFDSMGMRDIESLEPFTQQSAKMWEQWSKIHSNVMWEKREDFLRDIAPRWDFDVKHYNGSRFGIDTFGWLPLPLAKFPDEVEQEHLKQAERFYKSNYQQGKINPMYGRAFEKILERCQEKQIKAIIYLMPESSLFRSWYTPESEHNLQGFLRSLQEKYPVTIIDSRDWVVDQDFLDGHHLYPQGAKRFAQRLGEELLKVKNPIREPIAK